MKTAIILFLISWMAAARGAESVVGSLRVDPEFAIEVAAGSPMVRFPMFACFDDEGRLYVAESSGNDLYAGLRNLTRDCRVSRLEDKNGDGRFETATVFQDRVTFPMGLAWREGKLYLADPPDLVMLSDTDGDGRADEREVLLSGFGHTDNGSLHGLIFGPDGLLYFTMGTPDGWRLPRGDGTFVEGEAGALFRRRPDGLGIEVICRGFENLVEVDFLPGGQIIGTDNWYQKPAGGLRDALIDCAPGGLYPFAPDRGTPLPRTGITLPPLKLMPAVAHSGLVRVRGSSLPPGWSGSLMVAEHNTRKVVRHKLRAEGSTFAAASEDFIVGEHPDFHPADVLEDADGSLLIVDTGGWYVEHCPTGRIRDSRAPGGVYRVRWKPARKVVDPRGGTIQWQNLARGDLERLLRDARYWVSERAAAELVRLRETVALVMGMADRETSEVRLRSLWGLVALRDQESMAAIRQQLSATDPVVACAAARAAGLLRDKAANEALLGMIQSTNAHVRRAAAEALARCGNGSDAPALVAGLAKAGDAFEQHAFIAAILAIADERFVRGLLQHDSPTVRRAALHLLDQPPFETLRFSDLINPLVDEAALRDTAIQLLERHPEWSREALPWLREQLPKNENNDALESLLVAFQQDSAVRRLISELLAANTRGSETTRSFLIQIVPLMARTPPEKDWLEAIDGALTNGNLRAAAIGAAKTYNDPRFARNLARIAEDENIKVPERLHAARALPGSPLSEGVFGIAAAALREETGSPGRLAALDLLGRARLTGRQTRELLTILDERNLPIEAVLPALIRGAGIEPRGLAAFLKGRLESGWSPPGATMEQVAAAFEEPERKFLLARWEENSAAKIERLRELRPLLGVGDAERGRLRFASAGCAVCHKVGDHGGVAGPDLTKIGAIRSGEDLLESIVYPSSSFAQGFEPYLLKRREGEEIAGTILSQNADGVKLRDLAGELHYVRSADILSLKRQDLSTMPEGLDKTMSGPEFGDLIAYLRSLK